MNLILAKTYPINAISIQNVESVSEDLILLNLELRGDKLHWDARPYHWLYDFGDFPPLDVSFDSETGLLKEMTIFINKQQLQQQHSYPLTVLSNIEGYPAFDTTSLSHNSYYYDELADIVVSLADSCLIAARKGVDTSVQLKVTDTLDILLTAQSQFVGFIVYKIDHRQFM